MTTLQYSEISSPVGRLFVAGDERTLYALHFDGHWPEGKRRLERRFSDLCWKRSDNASGAVGSLRAYFDGDLGALDRVAVDPGGTEFQARVWKALRTIAVGETRTYGDIARSIGQPSAVRAVGLANGANPIAIVIPCHRVIGSNRRLTGYGGGLDRKAWLLRHEGCQPGLDL